MCIELPKNVTIKKFNIFWIKLADNNDVIIIDMFLGGKFKPMQAKKG